jgi:hypothetical protein
MTSALFPASTFENPLVPDSSTRRSYKRPGSNGPHEPAGSGTVGAPPISFFEAPCVAANVYSATSSGTSADSLSTPKMPGISSGPSYLGWASPAWGRQSLSRRGARHLGELPDQPSDKRVLERSTVCRCSVRREHELDR